MFVVVGEALVDLVGQHGERTLEAHPGGSPANVALGLARLGGLAGDSSTSGLLHELRRADLIGGARRDGLAAIDEATLTSVVDTAALIAAVTCSRPGADPPTREEADSARTARPRVGPLAPAGPEEWG